MKHFILVVFDRVLLGSGDPLTASLCLRPVWSVTACTYCKLFINGSMQVKFGFSWFCYFPLDYVLEFCFLNRLVPLGGGELALVVDVLTVWLGVQLALTRV